MREHRQLRSDFGEGSVDVQVRDAQVLRVAQSFESGFGSQHDHSSYCEIITETQAGLIEIDGNSFGSAYLLGDFTCRLQVPSSDEHSNAGVPLAEPPDGSAPHQARSSGKKYLS
ncbi:hypothetical protein [Nostoc sp. CALU 1950]|uniref:hypothetical protein n=1 Tax=Nostoc sp. CALU 1950 TaxID=3104321 RepID=UPI003EBE26BA